MMKKILLLILKRLGYDIKTTDKAIQQKGLYQLYAYTRKDGSFDYDRYKRVQTEGNKKKLDSTWVLEENIAFYRIMSNRLWEPFTSASATALEVEKNRHGLKNMQDAR